jgi:hypothetical protein
MPTMKASISRPPTTAAARVKSRYKEQTDRDLDHGNA